jgi:predicted permease
MKKPTRIAERIMFYMVESDEREFILGDLEEYYSEKLQRSGRLKANLWYWSQVVKSFHQFEKNIIQWRAGMLKNYLKIAFRNFKKHKVYSFINISGLAVGMACCMLIMLWVQDELNYERFQKQLDKIFCVVQWNPSRDANQFGGSIPAPLIPHLKKNYPEIKHSTRYKASGRRLFSYKGNHFFEDGGAFADPELFNIFTFKLVRNDPQKALRDFNSIVLTRNMAERYFGSEDPLGKVLTLENKFDFQVAAIIEDIPRNSSIRFDYLVRFENFGRFDQVEMDNWGRYENYKGFLILNAHINHQSFSKKIADLYKVVYPNNKAKLSLYPYKDLRLYGLNNDGTLKFVLVFSVIAFLVLLIACINFVNLTTAQSGKKSKEIGLRKVIGANRALIRRQIYSESLLMVTIAFILAILISLALLPALNTLSGKTLSFSDTVNSGMLTAMFAIALITAGISGTYPAFYLSRFSPVKVMKSGFSTGSTSLLRKLLVMAQFSISIILIISTLLIGRQMNYIQNKELGFDKEHLIHINLLGNLKERFDTVKSELLRNPSINNVTVATSLPNNAANNAGGLDWEGKPADVRGAMNFISVEKDYFKTVGIEFIEGRTFRTTPSNSELREFIINEKALETMHIENHVGKSFKMWDRAPGRIIGIVRNVHNASLHQEIRPVFYVQFPYFYNYLLINIRKENIQATIDYIRGVCKKLNPNYPFEFHFLDEDVDQAYQKERQIYKILAYFTILAMLLSCLGLFGLSLFMGEQRTKEIGIRKTLGATISSIVGLMSKNFLFLVVISNIIAWPAAYFIMRQWLQNFVYRIDFGISIFILSALAGLLIAFFSISFQAVRAARSNPVDALRYE